MPSYGLTTNIPVTTANGNGGVLSADDQLAQLIEQWGKRSAEADLLYEQTMAQAKALQREAEIFRATVKALTDARQSYSEVRLSDYHAEDGR